MNTVIKNWYVLSVMNKEAIMAGKILWGVVIDDTSCRFLKDDFLCSSEIIEHDLYTKLIKTQNGGLYQLIGSGSQAEISINEYELLRVGISLKEIILLRDKAMH
jgi:hypothetical protein